MEWLIHSSNFIPRVALGLTTCVLPLTVYLIVYFVSAIMQERRVKKIKKGSHRTFTREARRLERMHWLSTAKAAAGGGPVASVEQCEQSRLILELAWKTVALMQKNTLIQQKIVDLQKETSDFITTVMNNPDNKNKCLSFMQLNSFPILTMTPEVQSSDEHPFKIEPINTKQFMD